METLGVGSDVSLLEALADPDRHEILRVLLEGPATQKELAAALQMHSGTVSKHMAKLARAGIVFRQRSHSPYELRFRDGVLQLLQANANLLVERSAAIHEQNLRQQKEINRAGIRSARSDESETA